MKKPSIKIGERIDRNWTPHGRVRIATKMLVPKVVKELGLMLDHLKQTGNVALWKALSRKDTTPLVLLAKYQQGELKGVVTAETVISAKADMMKWANAIPVAATKKGYKETINNFFRVNPDATVAEMPDVLKERGEYYQKLGQKRTFEDCRKVSSSWAGVIYGQDSTLWKQLRAIKFTIIPSTKHTGLAREVWDVVATCRAMAEPFGRQFFTMCILGTGTKEYLVDGYELFESYAVVYGPKSNNRKQKSRIRKVPLIFAHDSYVKPTVTYANRQRLAREVQAVSKGWKLYDARRSFILWMEGAGIPTSRNHAYAGHVSGTVNEGYRKAEVEPHLKADAELLRTYINARLKKPEAVIPAVIPAFTGFAE